MDVHELTAGYALDALDAAERERYEAHLASCERCREELQGFWSVAGSRAQAAGGPAPPPALRERIRAQAPRQRPNVGPRARRARPPVVPPPPRRPAFRIVSSAAAVAAVAALGLGLWASSLSGRLDDAEQELAVLSDPNAQVFESEAGEARLVVTPTGDAALVVRRIAGAPDGRDYQIWVFEDGAPRGAGLFEEPGVALLTRKVDAGQTVAVTLEPDGGLDAPSGTPLFTASRS